MKDILGTRINVGDTVLVFQPDTFGIVGKVDRIGDELLSILRVFDIKGNLELRSLPRVWEQAGPQRVLVLK